MSFWHVAWCVQNAKSHNLFNLNLALAIIDKLQMVLNWLAWQLHFTCLGTLQAKIMCNVKRARHRPETLYRLSSTLLLATSERKRKDLWLKCYVLIGGKLKKQGVTGRSREPSDAKYENCSDQVLICTSLRLLSLLTGGAGGQRSLSLMSDSLIKVQRYTWAARV